MRIIASITNANPAVVTTTFAHQYITGAICRLIIPPGYGMYQANTLYAPITVTGSTTFTIAIDTTQFQPFSTPSEFPQTYQYAMVTPVGELSNLLSSAVQNVLPYTAS
jgi:hypothetical protein